MYAIQMFEHAINAVLSRAKREKHKWLAKI